MTAVNGRASFEIYTDGACDGNPGGPGGWAAILISDQVQQWYSGHEDRTTNNRMEITAAIKGLEQTPEGSEVEIFSDSQYLVNTMTKHWQKKLNTDLWARLDPLVARRKITWAWVRGHNGHPLNEEVDRLAVEAKRHKDWGERSGSYGTSVVETQPPLLPEPAHLRPGLELSHVDAEGRARMVDVSPKADTERVAVAAGRVVMQPATLRLIMDNAIAKGDVLTVAQIAGIMAAKRTSELIPMCHPLMLTHVSVDLEADEAASAVLIRATARTTGKTGVEMEALTAATVAALTVYDMAKAVDRGMRIEGVHLLQKSGGKSGEYVAED